MNKQIAILAAVATLWFTQIASAQTETTTNEKEKISTTETEFYEDVDEAIEVTREVEELEKQLDKFNLSYFDRTETDTIVRYRKQVMPFVNFGFANVATEGQFSNSAFGYLRSTSFEFGLMIRRPFNELNNVFGIRYGLSFSYNALTPNGNNIFVLNGNQTELAPYSEDLRRGRSYFRNSYFNIPFALDFDFSTKAYDTEKRKFVKKTGVNFGVGGYVGVNINSKHFISYKDENNYKHTIREHGKWNVNDFNYGLMAYVGYGSIKAIAKYDLQPVFKNNPQNQNFWSLGLQYEFR